MADFAVAKFLLPSTLGTFEVTIPGFGVPQAAFIIAGGGYTTLETIRDDAPYCVGATDGTRQWFMANSSLSNYSRSDGELRAGANTACIYVINDDGTGAYHSCTGVGDGSGSNPGPITNGWRFQMTEADTTEQRFAQVLFIRNADNVYAGLTVPLGIQGATTNVTAPGFQADFILTAANAADMTQTTPGVPLAGTIGASVVGISNVCMAVAGRNNTGTSRTGCTTRSARCSGQYYNDAWSWGVTSGVNANGFDLTVQDGDSAGDVVGYLAIKYADGEFSSVLTNSPTSTTVDWSITGIGFEAESAILIGTQSTGDNLHINGNAASYALLDNNNFRTATCRSQDAITDSLSSCTSADKISYLLDDTGVLLHDIGFSDPGSGFTADGLTVNANDIATADTTTRRWLAVFFKGSGTSPPATSIPALLSANPEVIGS